MQSTTVDFVLIRRHRLRTENIPSRIDAAGHDSNIATFETYAECEAQRDVYNGQYGGWDSSGTIETSFHIWRRTFAP